ncbi:MAG: hypothetical protein SF097_07095 [Acidobacteriota bacterium]|nr:hypothetical protein [Acidobacteriota bacterium]
MRVKTISLLLCWVLLLTSPGVLAQQVQTPNQSWDDLRQTLTAGKLRVEKKDNKKVTGQLKSISDSELVIERKGKDLNIERQQVKTVWTVAPASAVKRRAFSAMGFAGGLLGGAMIAVGLGFKQCGGSCADEGTGIAAALIGLPIAGIYIGHKLAGDGKRTLVYSAP